MTENAALHNKKMKVVLISAAHVAFGQHKADMAFIVPFL